MLGAALPPRPPGGAPPKELPPAGQRRLPDGRRPDHLWSVLHRREESQGPRHRAESREEGGRRESRSLPSRPEMEMEPMQYPGQLPPLGWAPSPMPAMAMPNLAPENDWRDFKANLRPRMVVDSGAEAKEWLERRLDSALTEQRAELTRRFAGFEQSDKHFKDWVQREHEQLHSQLQQLRVSLQETASQQQRLVGNLTAQGQKQDMRLQELEGQMAQAAAQLQGLMNAVSAGALQGAGGNGGGTGEAAMGAAAVAASASANLEVLRAGLEREAQQRVQLGAETAEQLKQLSDMVYELNSRQQQQQSSQQQQLQQNAVQEEKDLVRSEARFAALEPSVLQLREELEEMRKMLYKCGADCAKRCDENEEICNKRLGGVQEAALSAARELWEEHQGVVVECKSSLSALQQILDSKDKIALQLRSLQQQQREEDKQEFWSQMQLRHEQLQAKLADTERALQTEQNTRIEEQQRYETVLSRLGLALEKAQAAWLRDSAKLSQEIHEAKRDFSIEMDGETRGVARRLADGLEAQQKLADELERKLALAKTELGSVLERLDSTARAQQQELRDAEGRLMRQVNDVQTIQGGRTQQAVFDMKAELAKQEQVSAARLPALQKGQDELEGRAMMALNNLETRTLQKIQDSADLEREKTRNEMTRALEEERTERLRMDEELREEHLRHLTEMREQVDDNKKELNEIVQNAEERLVKRLEDQVTVERTKTREQIEAFIEEERSERLKAEAERLTSLQKRLQAHEELTLQRLSEQRARWETEVETLRQKLEAQALKDKQDLNKDLQDFVQEERQVTSGLADDMRVLGGECQSLAESFQKHQSATEQRLAHEAAALSAQLSVGNASLTALLAQHGQTQQLALETRAREITGEIVKVSDELDKMNGEILKLIDDESDKVKEKHLAMESRVGTLEMAFTARTAALGEQDQVLQERMEELARQNGEAIENMRETLTSETGKLLEHMGRVQDDVKSVEAEALRRCEDMAEAQSEAKMEMDNMFGTFQANLGELGAKIEDVAISQSKIHTELKEGPGSGWFMSTGGAATRQQMIEYLSLLRWSQATWVSAPYANLLWASVVTIINYRASSIASHEIRRGVIDNLEAIEALPTRGMAPVEVQVGKALGDQQGGSSCSCTCGIFRTELCDTSRPERLHDFQGTMSLGHVAELRAQAAYFQEGVGNVSWSGLKWNNIRNQEDVMLWLQHGLLPVLWNQVGRDTAVDVDKMFDASADSILATRTTPGIFMNWMQIVGGVRLRQRRLQKGECSLDPRLQERFSPSCYTEFLQVSPFGPGIGSYAEGFVPEDVMGAFDVRYSLGTPFREILENFQYMLKEHNWVGEASQSLQIQAAMVHGEATPPFFVMFEVRFDFKRSGYVAKELNIFLTATDMFPTTLEVVLHVLWALILFSLLFTQSFKTMSTYLSTRKKQLFAVDVRFVSDWIVIVFSIFIVGFFILIQQSIWDLAALVQEMPEYSPSASASEMETHERSWTLILDRVDEAAFFFNYFRVALFWYTLVIATQFSKIFAGQPKLAQLMSAFTHASEDLLHFCLLFLVLFLSFAIGGFMIWGMIMEEWSTPGKAVNSTLRALMGEVKLEEMYSYAPFGTLVWYGSFFVSIVVITLNLLVAMVYDHYTIIKGRAGSVAGVVEQLYWVSQDMSARLKGKSLWVKLTCCLRRHERIPMHRDLLEVCMEKAKLPNFERKAISSSVLGAKWTKKERERQLFSGQDVPETDEQMPVLPDFDEVDVDPDYADSLAAHAKEYAEAGYDPEDARVSQLRQLVAAAEDEIIDMRLRLQSCAEYTRQSMHGLTRRVDSLEQLVHSTLAELVTIANEAGVPTGGKARKGAQSPAPTSPGATGVQTALTGLGGSRQESKQEIDMVKKWHKASRAVNVRAARAEPPPNAKFFGPR